MADKSKIEWCDATLNLWWGCTKVSAGCKFCYAEHLADHRYHKGNWGPSGTRKEVKRWRSELSKISKRAKEENQRLRVFCQSMSDTFEGPETMGGKDSENWTLVRNLRKSLLQSVLDHPELDFLILTKRPENIASAVSDFNFLQGWATGQFEYPPNAWFGTSVEDQKTADERIPHLLKIPAAVRFLSCEPLLGSVKLLRTDGHPPDGEFSEYNWLTGKEFNRDVEGQGLRQRERIHWVICGGESGPNARPMHPDWARSLQDQCRAAGVPFLLKQWGEFLHTDCLDSLSQENYRRLDARQNLSTLDPQFLKVGKKAAGRILDGRTWDEFPEVAK